MWERPGLRLQQQLAAMSGIRDTSYSLASFISSKSCGAKMVVSSDAVATPCSAHTFCPTSTMSRQGLVVHQISIWTRCRDPGGRNVLKKSAKPSSIVSGLNVPPGGKLASTKPGRACPCGPPRLKRWLESTLQSGLLATLGCRSSSGSERLRRGSAIGSLTWPSGAREGLRLYLEGGGPGCRSVPTVGRWTWLRDGGATVVDVALKREGPSPGVSVEGHRVSVVRGSS